MTATETVRSPAASPESSARDLSTRCFGWVGRLTVIAVLVAASFVVGLNTRASSITGPHPTDLIALALAQTELGDPAAQDYSFFTNRRYLWVVKHSTGQAQFFHVPETESSEQPLVKSRVHQIDRAQFPLDEVKYQVSERNLSLFLWITNPVTGKAHFVRARRDGGFDVSPVIDAKVDM